MWFLHVRVLFKQFGSVITLAPSASLYIVSDCMHAARFIQPA